MTNDRQAAVELAVPLCKHYEGFRPEAYKCQSGQLTIGYGHCRTAELWLGKRIAKSRAEQLLRHDLAECWDLISHYRLTSYQAAALLCFAMNTGSAAFLSSTLKRECLDKGDLAKVPEQLMRWTKDWHGQVSAGKFYRRFDECKLWLGYELTAWSND